MERDDLTNFLFFSAAVAGFDFGGAAEASSRFDEFSLAMRLPPKLDSADRRSNVSGDGTMTPFDLMGLQRRRHKDANDFS